MNKLKIVSILISVLIFVISASILFVCAQAEEPLTFYWISRNAADPYMGAVYVGAQQKAEELGVEVKMLDARDKPLIQLQLIDQVITAKADGVFMNPVEGASVVPGIEALNEANIPVIATEVWPKGGKCIVNITSHGELLCKKLADGMVELLKEKYGDIPDGVILGIMGRIGDSYNDVGVKGFNEGIEPYQQLKVVWAEGKYDPSVAFEKTSDLLTKYKDKVVGVFMRTDVMSPGVISAIEDAGYDPADIIIVSSDGQPSGLDFLREGKIDLIAPEQPIAIGRLAVQFLYNYHHDGELPGPGKGIIEEEGAVWSPATVLPSDIGPIILLNALLIPTEISVDDPRNWGNTVD